MALGLEEGAAEGAAVDGAVEDGELVVGEPVVGAAEASTQSVRGSPLSPAQAVFQGASKQSKHDAPWNMPLWEWIEQQRERRCQVLRRAEERRARSNRDVPHVVDLAHVPLREIRGKRRRTVEHLPAGVGRAAKSAGRQVLR